MTFKSSLALFGAMPERLMQTGPQATSRRWMASSDGARELSHRSYANLSVPELAEDLSAWTRRWALARGRMNPDIVANALQLWLSPAACDDVDGATHALVVDPFVARAVRYAALRLSPEITGYA
jgi:hypothetical protein